MPSTVDPAQLDLGYLALFVGQRVNERVAEQLEAAGFLGLRQSHGYVFQHLLGGARTITELARLLGVSQQAASKSVAELSALGYLSREAADDRRATRIALSPRGRACIEQTRRLRAGLERRLERRHGEALRRARTLLAQVLAGLGGASAVRHRRVREPR